MLTVSLFLGPEERERVWDTYSGLERELGTLRETLEYLLHLGSPPGTPLPQARKPCLALPSSLGYLNKCRKNSYKM